MRPILLLILISLMNIPGCDLTGGTDYVQKRAETQVLTYFPNGRVTVSPQQESIFVVTCAQGLGKPFLEEIVKNVENNRGFQQLRRARQLPLKLSPYRFIVLGFDEYVIRLDTDTEQHWIAASDLQTSLHYEAECSNKAGRSGRVVGNQAARRVFGISTF